MSRLSIPEKESIVHSYQASGQNTKDRRILFKKGEFNMYESINSILSFFIEYSKLISFWVVLPYYIINHKFLFIHTYIGECKELEKMKDRIDKGLPLNYSSKPNRNFGLFSFLYLFQPFPPINTKYYEHPRFVQQVNLIKKYKRFYFRSYIFLFSWLLYIVGLFEIAAFFGGNYTILFRH